MTTTTQDRDLQMPGRPEPTPRGHLGLIVAASLATGLGAALALVAAPFIPAKENVLTGVVLLAFALGWALLAVLSTRFSSQPQRWAAAPAAFMAVAGLVSLLPPGSFVHDVLAGYGRPSCSDWLSGCSFGPDDSCAAEAHGGCCTPSWL